MSIEKTQREIKDLKKQMEVVSSEISALLTYSAHLYGKLKTQGIVDLAITIEGYQTELAEYLVKLNDMSRELGIEPA